LDRERLIIAEAKLCCSNTPSLLSNWRSYRVEDFQEAPSKVLEEIIPGFDKHIVAHPECVDNPEIPLSGSAGVCFSQGRIGVNAEKFSVDNAIRNSLVMGGYVDLYNAVLVHDEVKMSDDDYQRGEKVVNLFYGGTTTKLSMYDKDRDAAEDRLIFKLRKSKTGEFEVLRPVDNLAREGKLLIREFYGMDLSFGVHASPLGRALGFDNGWAVNRRAVVRNSFVDAWYLANFPGEFPTRAFALYGNCWPLVVPYWRVARQWCVPRGVVSEWGKQFSELMRVMRLGVGSCSFSELSPVWILRLCAAQGDFTVHRKVWLMCGCCGLNLAEKFPNLVGEYLRFVNEAVSSKKKRLLAPNSIVVEWGDRRVTLVYAFCPGVFCTRVHLPLNLMEFDPCILAMGPGTSVALWGRGFPAHFQFMAHFGMHQFNHVRDKGLKILMTQRSAGTFMSLVDNKQGQLCDADGNRGICEFLTCDDDDARGVSEEKTSNRDLKA